MGPRVAIGFVLTATVMGIAPSTRGSVSAGREGPLEQETVESYDERLARVEERAPGFGGMFIGQDGRLAVYLLDKSQLAAARSAIEIVFGAERLPAAGIRALRGQYTVSQLKRWAERATEILEVSGVTMVDLDEAKNRVAIGIEDNSWTRTVEQALVSLGIPRKAVVMAVTGQIRPLKPTQPESRPRGRVRRQPPPRPPL